MQDNWLHRNKHSQCEVREMHQESFQNQVVIGSDTVTRMRLIRNCV